MKLTSQPKIYRGGGYTLSRAFTLIELLVVIAIIGILATVVIASLNNARIRARDARRVSDLKQIQTALELYFNEYGTYPLGGNSTNAGAGSDRIDWRNNTGETVSHPLGALKDAGFLGVVPVDPGRNRVITIDGGCGAAQMYVYSATKDAYLLGAVQEAMGTSGCTQAGNWNSPTATNYTFQYYIRSGM